MTRVLVTGATGFIGRHASEILAAGEHEVHAVVAREPDDPIARVTYHRVNLLDPETTRAAVRSIAATHLLHFAWYAVPKRFWTSLENYRWVGATMDLAAAFAEAGGTRIVAAGSCAEYDWRFGCCREEVTPIAPSTPYGVTKSAACRLLMSYGEQTGVRVAWGRIFFVYGPRERPERLVSSVIQSLLAGRRAECGDGRPVRDFLHVRDVASAFAALVDADVRGAVNVSSSRPIAVRDVVEEIGRQLGASDRIAFGALPPRDEPPLLVGDNHRLRTETGWTPTFDIGSGIEDTIRWWRGGSE